VNHSNKNWSKNRLSRENGNGLCRPGGLLGLTLAIVLLCACSTSGQPQQPAPVPGTAGAQPNASLPDVPTATPEQQPGQRSPGDVTGTVLDQTGAVVAGARVTLTVEGQSPSREALSNSDGQFSFANVAPGTFQLTISFPGFTTQKASGILTPGGVYIVPPIALPIATELTEVHVGPQSTELAEEQIKEQEKQRVLGVIPNFYVSYIPDAVPLTPKQKFELAWKTTIDPVTFVIVGATAGLQQAENNFSGYGQGAQGYGKRYGANYGDTVTGTFLGDAVFPSLMKQDPRYFYKGTGSVRSRILYAIAMSVICKGDNGHWQLYYSGILGGLVAGGISNAYYPPKDRGAALVFENELIGIGGSAAGNIIQEFIIPKLTPNLPNHRTSKQP
jgi:Carboxypeptidase regulatory-like domain